MRELVKSLFRKAGLSVRRLAHDSSYTLLGLGTRPIRAIVDVGANEGQFARQMAHLFPRASLWCFEPLPEVYASLERWARTQVGRVTTFNVALADEEGVMTMHRHLDHSPSSSLLEATRLNDALFPQTTRREDISVPVRRLDSFELWSNVQASAGEALLKLDVQGVEDRVLRGSERTLAAMSHVILEVSLDGLYQQQATFVSLVSELSAHGFVYRGNVEQAYAADWHVIFIDALFGRAEER